MAWHICEITWPRIDPLIRDENGFCVAQAVKPANSRAAYIDERANARLIAAAPDLLAALEGLLSDAIELGLADSEYSGSAIEARAAIAKAKGL